jgi:hypothetical protein
MSTVLPLPLQLTQPTQMASSLEEVLKESYQVESTKYNPETQVRETSEGVPMLYNGGGHTSCKNDTKSYHGLVVVDIQIDLQVDDIL